MLPERGLDRVKDDAGALGRTQDVNVIQECEHCFIRAQLGVHRLERGVLGQIRPRAGAVQEEEAVPDDAPQRDAEDVDEKDEDNDGQVPAKTLHGVVSQHAMMP